MRHIEQIVIHASATAPSLDIGAEEIRVVHINKGWSDIGYHYVIRRDGTLETGRKVERQGAHVKHFNEYSIGICLIGGVDEKNKPDSNFTKRQLNCLFVLVDHLTIAHETKRVLGHRDFEGVNKACPCFDVASFFEGCGYVV